jgi:MFS family permease
LSTSLGLVCLGFCETYYQVAFVRFTFGLCQCSFAIGQAYISDMCTSLEKAQFVGYIGTVVGVAYATGPGFGATVSYVLGTFVNDRVKSLQYTFFIVGCSCLPVLLYLFCNLKDGDKKHFEELEYTQRNNRTALGLISVCYALAVYVTTTMQTYYTVTLTDTLMITNRVHLGIVFSIGGVIMAVVQFYMKPLIALVGIEKLCILGSITASSSIFGLAVPTQEINLAFYPLLAFGFGLISSAFPIYATEHATATNQGGALGLMQSLGAATSIAVPLIGGLLLLEGEKLGTVYFKGEGLVYFFGGCMGMLGVVIFAVYLYCNRKRTVLSASVSSLFQSSLPSDSHSVTPYIAM